MRLELQNPSTDRARDPRNGIVVGNFFLEFCAIGAAVALTRGMRVFDRLHQVVDDGLHRFTAHNIGEIEQRPTVVPVCRLTENIENIHCTMVDCKLYSVVHL